jgi:hypothetical protein
VLRNTALRHQLGLYLYFGYELDILTSNDPPVTIFGPLNTESTEVKIISTVNEKPINALIILRVGAQHSVTCSAL